jgi:hypothetical protein
MVSIISSGKSGKNQSKVQLRPGTKLSTVKLAAFVSSFALIASFFIIQSYASPHSRGVNLYLEPSSQKVSAGSTLSLQIWLDTKSEPVNAVQANLTYPVDKFNFESIDSTGSAFEVEAQSSGGNGIIKVARGHVGSITGVQLVATLNLKSLSSSGKASIDFASGSAAVRSTDNVNVLQSTTGSRFTISSLLGGSVSNSAFKINKHLFSQLHRP